jgi:Uma2 family endonuclease
MSAIQRPNLMSVEDYLAGELDSPVKHEYLGGVVYAMSGAKIAHNRIATNITGLLHARLRGQPCQPYNSDTKIRIRLPTHTRFYYPDASVVCHSNPPDDSYQDEPVVVFEVIPEATRRTDEGEKRDAYLTLQSLSIYVLAEQDGPLLVVYRRTDHGFKREIYEGLDQVLPLPEIATELPLAEIYEGLEFASIKAGSVQSPKSP